MVKRKKIISNNQEIQNSAKTMLANIRFASVDNPIQSIVVTSAIPNEGKTTTTVELAKAIATAGNSVLVVEADMRHRSLSSLLGIHASHGAYSVMAQSVEFSQAVVETDIPNLHFLDIEPNIPNPVDLLSSHAYARLVDIACDNYDFVLFDTPPVGTFVDAAILSRLADGAIMIVKIGGAKRDEILTAYDQLEKAEANIIGACATFCEETSSEYYYAYYNKKDQRVYSKKEESSTQNSNRNTANMVPPVAPVSPRGEKRRISDTSKRSGDHISRDSREFSHRSTAGNASSRMYRSITTSSKKDVKQKGRW